ncbi:MAG: peroxiredoxin [Pirellulales bacterium]|nr:peroxiredoxin [Pirellulales bacterium]
MTTPTPMNPGDKAPDFELPGSDGKTHRLADHRGRRAVVLAWFPKAFTPGCTAECKSLYEASKTVRQFDVAYFAASCDTEERLADFARSLGLDYPILSDSKGQVAKAYGVVGVFRPWPRRWTFFIGADGKILAVDKDVRSGTHGYDVAKRLEELGIPKVDENPN